VTPPIEIGVRYGKRAEITLSLAECRSVQAGDRPGLFAKRVRSTLTLG